jgi:hypothetical protein
MTDGLIAYDEIQNFAKTTTELCLHGIPSIVIVFGHGTGHLPGDTDTSVGLALYARSPDSLFLFHDIDTGSVYIIQAKDSFKYLLKGKEQPDITEGASWENLPSIECQDLANIAIRLPKKLLPDQLALQDGLVIRLKDLFKGKVDEVTSEKIANNEDSMASITQAEMSSKYSEDTPYDRLARQATNLSPDRPQYVLRKDPCAVVILAHLLKGMELGKSDAQLLIDYTLLAMEHDANRNAFIGSFKQHEEAVKKTVKKNDSASASKKHLIRMKMSKKKYESGELLSPAPARGTMSWSKRASSVDIESVYEDFEELNRTIKRPKLTPILQGLPTPYRTCHLTMTPSSQASRSREPSLALLEVHDLSPSNLTCPRSQSPRGLCGP